VHGDLACSEGNRRSRSVSNVFVESWNLRGGPRGLYDMAGGSTPHSGDFPEWKQTRFILLKCSHLRMFQGSGHLAGSEYPYIVPWEGFICQRPPRYGY
jgi:hypothetical protein